MIEFILRQEISLIMESGGKGAGNLYEKEKSSFPFQIKRGSVFGTNLNFVNKTDSNRMTRKL